MSSNLYLLFETAEAAQATLPQFLQNKVIPGYSFWVSPLKDSINVPGETDVLVRYSFYAQNHFRIHISDLVIQFCHESTLPPELATVERNFQATVFGMPQFRLRRWIITEEGWDDNDNPFMHILNEGSSPESLNAEQVESSS